MLFATNLFLLGVVLIIVLLSAGVLGRWLGRRDTGSAPVQAQIGVVQGALLGLLGLLIGFTFSMAVSRYEARKELVVREADAVGTAFLRAQVLPQTQRDDALGVFRLYLQSRIDASQTALDATAQVGLEAQAAELFDRLWKGAISAIEQDSRAPATVSYMESLNEVGDARARRNAALENHVPESVFWLITAVAALTVAYVGYGVGLTQRRQHLTLGTLCLVITLVMLLIEDMDRPRRGLIQIGQSSLLEVQRQVGAP